MWIRLLKCDIIRTILKKAIWYVYFYDTYDVAIWILNLTFQEDCNHWWPLWALTIAFLRHCLTPKVKPDVSLSSRCCDSVEGYGKTEAMHIGNHFLEVYVALWFHRSPAMPTTVLRRFPWELCVTRIMLSGEFSLFFPLLKTMFSAAQFSPQKNDCRTTLRPINEVSSPIWPSGFQVRKLLSSVVKV